NNEREKSNTENLGYEESVMYLLCYKCHSCTAIAPKNKKQSLYTTIATTETKQKRDHCNLGTLPSLIIRQSIAYMNKTPKYSTTALRHFSFT
ncbi:35839_t:CDS:2, partial [Racocetra persica]